MDSAEEEGTMNNSRKGEVREEDSSPPRGREYGHAHTSAATSPSHEGREEDEGAKTAAAEASSSSPSSSGGKTAGEKDDGDRVEEASRRGKDGVARDLMRLKHAVAARPSSSGNEKPPAAVVPGAVAVPPAGAAGEGSSTVPMPDWVSRKQSGGHHHPATAPGAVAVPPAGAAIGGSSAVPMPDWVSRKQSGGHHHPATVPGAVAVTPARAAGDGSPAVLPTEAESDESTAVPMPDWVKRKQSGGHHHPATVPGAVAVTPTEAAEHGSPTVPPAEAAGDESTAVPMPDWVSRKQSGGHHHPATVPGAVAVPPARAAGGGSSAVPSAEATGDGSSAVPMPDWVSRKQSGGHHHPATVPGAVAVPPARAVGGGSSAVLPTEAESDGSPAVPMPDWVGRKQSGGHHHPATVPGAVAVVTTGAAENGSPAVPPAEAASDESPAVPMPDWVGRKQSGGHHHPATVPGAVAVPLFGTASDESPAVPSAETTGDGASAVPMPEWVGRKQSGGHHNPATVPGAVAVPPAEEASDGSPVVPMPEWVGRKQSAGHHHPVGAPHQPQSPRGNSHSTPAEMSDVAAATTVQASDLLVQQKQEEDGTEKESKQLGAVVNAVQAGGAGGVQLSGEGAGKEDGEMLHIEEAERGKLAMEEEVKQDEQRKSDPGTSTTEGINSTHHGWDSDDDSVTEPPNDDREVRRPAGIEESSHHHPPQSSPSPPMLPTSQHTNVDIEVVATLVEPDLTLEEGRAEYPEEWGDPRGGRERAPSAIVVAVATAQKLKFGINFSDRRVTLAACLIILVFVALAVGLGVALGGAAGGSGGNASAVGRIGDSEDDSSDDGETLLPTDPPTPQPTFSPTTASPSLSPTLAPTVLAWERVGSTLDGEGDGGQFGHQVSISTDGSTVLGGYKSAQRYSSLRYLALSWTVTAAKIFEATDTEADGEDVWNMTTAVGPDCLYWTATTMALSGSGKVAALASVGCDTFTVDIWSKYPPFSLPMLRPPMPPLPLPESSLPQLPSSSPSSPPSSPPPPEADWTSMPGITESLRSDYDFRRAPPLQAALSWNGRTIAIAHDGSTRVYEIDLPGASGAVEGDRALSISADGTTIALASQVVPVDELLDDEGNPVLNDLGEPVPPLPLPPRDIVRVRRRGGLSGWSQVGPDLSQSAFVKSTSLSADGTVIAVGGAERDEMPMQMPCSSCGPERGRVRVYRLDDVDHGGNWTLMGQPLIGDSFRDNFGASVSLSGDGMHLAVGLPGSNAGGFGSGAVRVLRYDADGDEWVRVEKDISGSEGGEAFGSAVAMTGDGRRVAVGAPKNRAGGNDSGRVSVFQLNAM